MKQNEMSTKVSMKDRIVYLAIIVSLILSLTRDKMIWTSKTGYYIRIMMSLIVCIVFTIISLLNFRDVNNKLKNKEKIYSKKEKFNMIFGISIDFITLILFIMVLISFI